MSDGAIIYCDGGARGNPGPAGAGYVIELGDRKERIEGKKFLGRTTNNTAEYMAVVLALEHLSRLTKSRKRRPSVDVYLDSELIVRQLTGLYRVKNENLRGLFERVQACAARFPRVRFMYIPRRANKEADQLVNAAINTAFPISDK